MLEPMAYIVKWEFTLTQPIFLEDQGTCLHDFFCNNEGQKSIKDEEHWKAVNCLRDKRVDRKIKLKVNQTNRNI